MNKYILLFLVFIFIRCSFLLATYSLESYSFLETTLYTVDTATRAVTGDQTIVLLEYAYLVNTFVDANSGLPDPSTSPAVIGIPTLYPNPFRFSDNPQFGYFLSKDLNIEIRIYDMKAHEIFRGNYIEGAPGGGTGYNRIYITKNDFGGRELSSGVYFFLIINEGKVLAKGKFVVKP